MEKGLQDLKPTLAAGSQARGLKNLAECNEESKPNFHVVR